MPYLKKINSLPLINHISYKYAQVSDIGPSWSSCYCTVMCLASSIIYELVIIPWQNKCFRGYTRISLSVSMPVCVQNTKCWRGYEVTFSYSSSFTMANEMFSWNAGISLFVGQPVHPFVCPW